VGILLLAGLVLSVVLAVRCYRAGVGAPITYVCGMVWGLVVLLSLPPGASLLATMAGCVVFAWLLLAPIFWLARQIRRRNR